MKLWTLFLILVALACCATFARADEANDRAVEAIKAALASPGCPCGPACPCPNCGCPYGCPTPGAGCVCPSPKVYSSPPAERRLISTYSTLDPRSYKNGDTIIIGVNCDAPASAYKSAVALSEVDNMRPGEYVVVGRWFDGSIYALGRLPTDATQGEIKKIVDDFNSTQAIKTALQQPQVVYVQQPMQGGACANGSCGSPTMMSGPPMMMGSQLFGGGRMMGGGVSCGAGG